MPNIIIKTQAELDALPDSFDQFTIIELHGGTPFDRLIVKKARESSHVEARESSHVVAWGSSHVVARESSHVVAWGSSHVVARESSHVVAWGSSHVVAWESSHVEARESSHVEARGSSHVEAWESSHVEARGSSHVEAWGSSHVEARESSHVVAWESVAIHNHSDFTTLDLFGFAVALLVAKAKKITRHGKDTTVVTVPARKPGVAAWLDAEGVEEKSGHVIVFKRVSKDFKTQEKTLNETLWQVGTTLEHPAWDPKREECGVGKYHACSQPYFCDEFRSHVGDVYVALKVAIADLYAWPNAGYPHKIAVRKATVLHLCDRYGKEITS